ncbi:MAG: hypothetical protein ACLFTB_00580 [Desulfovibrionales bacterium]
MKQNEIVHQCTERGKKHSDSAVQQSFGRADALLQLTDPYDLVRAHKELTAAIGKVYEEPATYGFYVLFTEKAVAALLSKGATELAEDTFYELYHFWLEHLNNADWFILAFCRMVLSLEESWLTHEEIKNAVKAMGYFTYFLNRYPETLIKPEFRELAARAGKPLLALDLKRNRNYLREYKKLQEFIELYSKAVGDPDFFTTPESLAIEEGPKKKARELRTALQKEDASPSDVESILDTFFELFRENSKDDAVIEELAQAVPEAVQRLLDADGWSEITSVMRSFEHLLSTREREPFYPAAAEAYARIAEFAHQNRLGDHERLYMEKLETLAREQDNEKIAASLGRARESLAVMLPEPSRFDGVTEEQALRQARELGLSIASALQEDRIVKAEKLFAEIAEYEGHFPENPGIRKIGQAAGQILDDYYRYSGQPELAGSLSTETGPALPGGQDGSNLPKGLDSTASEPHWAIQCAERVERYASSWDSENASRAYAEFLEKIDLENAEPGVIYVFCAATSLMVTLYLRNEDVGEIVPFFKIMEDVLIRHTDDHTAFHYGSAVRDLFRYFLEMRMEEDAVSLLTHIGSLVEQHGIDSLRTTVSALNTELGKHHYENHDLDLAVDRMNQAVFWAGDNPARLLGVGLKCGEIIKMALEVDELEAARIFHKTLLEICRSAPIVREVAVDSARRILEHMESFGYPRIEATSWFRSLKDTLAGHAEYDLAYIQALYNSYNFDTDRYTEAQAYEMWTEAAAVASHYGIMPEYLKPLSRFTETLASMIKNAGYIKGMADWFEELDGKFTGYSDWIIKALAACYYHLHWLDTQGGWPGKIVALTHSVSSAPPYAHNFYTVLKPRYDRAVELFEKEPDSQQNRKILASEASQYMPCLWHAGHHDFARTVLDRLKILCQEDANLVRYLAVALRNTLARLRDLLDMPDYAPGLFYELKRVYEQDPAMRVAYLAAAANLAREYGTQFDREALKYLKILESEATDELGKLQLIRGAGGILAMIENPDLGEHAQGAMQTILETIGDSDQRAWQSLEAYTPGYLQFAGEDHALEVINRLREIQKKNPSHNGHILLAKICKALLTVQAGEAVHRRCTFLFRQLLREHGQDPYLDAIRRNMQETAALRQFPAFEPAMHVIEEAAAISD